MTREIADTHELIFGVVRSSSRHMYEVANHNPPESAFRVKTARVENGYLQFCYREGADTAMALYWCNEAPTTATLDAILAQGYAAGFKELEIYVKSRYAYLFANQNLACESIEIERKIMERIDKNTLIHTRIGLTRDTEYAENAARRNGAQVFRSGTGCENLASQELHKRLGFYQYRYEYEKLL